MIGFAAGEPDFPTPPHIVEAAQAACRDPRNHKYSPAAGLPELREAVAEFTSQHNQMNIDPRSVVITNGGKQAIYNSLFSLLNPGDEVLLSAPYWVTYPHAVTMAGGVPVPLPTDRHSRFRLTVDQLEAARSERTKVLLFVSPSNPTGAVYTQEELIEIGRWAGEHQIWVLTDEIYHQLVYGEHRFFSLPGLCPELSDRWIIVNGVAKSYAMTGWRLGWLIGPSDLVKAASTLQSHSTSNVANVSQQAALAALTGPQEPVKAMHTAFDRRRKLMYKMLKAIPGVELTEPEGAFYAFADLSHFIRNGVGGQRFADTVELSGWILEQSELALVAGDAFGAPGYVRLSYALGDDDLVRGLTRLQKLLHS